MKKIALFAAAAWIALSGGAITVTLDRSPTADRTYKAERAGVTVDWLAFEETLSLATNNTPLVVNVPAGRYVISRPISIYSNTTLNLDANAVIVPTNNAYNIANATPIHGLLIAQHLSSPGVKCPLDATCRHGGYSQVENVTISGGKWMMDADPNNISYVFRLVHGSNITIKNLTCGGATEHCMNLSGTKNVKVENVVFDGVVKYTGRDLAFWKFAANIGNEDRYNVIESVHLDYVGKDSEGETYPVDDTPCRDVKVSKCTFKNTFAGVGTHRQNAEAGEEGSSSSLPPKFGSGIKVENCTFDNLVSYAFSAYCFGDSSFTGNNVKGGNIGVSILSGSDVKVSGNTFNDTAAHSICLAAQPGDAISLAAEGNKIYNADGQGIYVGCASGVVARLEKVVANLKGNTIDSPSANGIYLSCVEGTVDDCTINGAGLYGICAVDGANISASGNKISKSANSGVYVLGTSGAALTGNEISNAGNCGFQIGGAGVAATVSGNKILSSASHGVSVTDGAKVRLANNTFDGIGENGVTVATSASATISENTFKGVKNNGIDGASSAEITARENTLTAVGKYGFCAQSGAKIDAVANVVSNPVNSGVCLSGSGECVFKENDITGSGNCGLQVGGAGTVATIEGNRIASAASHGVSVTDGAKAILVDNTFEGAGGNGVTAATGAGATVENNTFKGVKNNGVDAASSAKVSAVENELESVGRYGFCAQSGSTIDAKYNIVTRPVNSGVCLSGAGECSFVDNEITSPGNCGFQVGSSQCTISGGKLAGPASHGVSATDSSAVSIEGGEYSSVGGYGFHAGGRAQISIDGAEMNGVGSDGVRSEGGAVAELFDTTFANVRGHGFCAQSGGVIIADGVLLSGVSGHGLYAGGESTRLEFSFGRVDMTGKNAVNVENYATAKVMDSVFTGIGAYGFCVLSGSQIEASGNEMSSPNNSGAYLLNCGMAYVTDNTFMGSGGAVAAVNATGVAANSLYITGNTIGNPSARGVYVQDVNGAVISDNLISGSRLEGVYVKAQNSAVRGVTVAGNDISGANAIGIRIEGSSSSAMLSSARVVGNASQTVSSADNARDIRICDFCENATVTGNSCRGKGFYANVGGLTGLVYEPGDAYIVSARYTSNTSAAISWERPESATSVIFEYASNPDFAWTASIVLRPTTTSYDLDGLDADKDWYVRVRTSEMGEDGTDRESAGSAVTTREITANDDVVFSTAPKGEGVAITGCRGTILRTLHIPSEIDGKSVVAISDGAFANVGSMMEVVVPLSVSSLGSRVFSGCTSLERIMLPLCFEGRLPASVLAGAPADASVEYYGAAYTVKFDPNGGTVAERSRLISAGSALGSLPVAERDGCDFLGWFSAVEGGKAIAESDVPDRDVTYYAQWKMRLVTVTFDANGGSVSQTRRMVACGTMLGELPTPTRNGWTFLGWFTAASDGVPVTAATIAAGDAIYYAHWDLVSWETKTVTGGVEIKSCSAPFGALEIPAVVNGKKVVAIRDYAFFNAKGLTSVSIPSSVAEIGVKAFKGCSSLKEVWLPARLKKLGQAAFQDCTSLTEFDVPNGIDYFWSSTFEGCLALQRVSLPEGITAIGTSSFANCKSLTEVNIPSTVKTIKSFAFFSCEKLPGVTLPNGLATIEQKAFKNCVSMEAIEIPSSVKTLGKAVFFNSGLVKAYVPGSVAKVDDYCFQKCSALQAVLLEEGVASTGASVWANDEALRGVEVPSTLQNLGAYAFFRCPSLGYVLGIEKVPAIGEKAFKHCASLGSLTLSEKVTAIPREMCNYCATLEKVEVDGTSAISSVGLSAFANCPALVAVEGLDAAALAKVKTGKEWKK